MGSSPVIPREQLSVYQRWELNSFDAAKPCRNGAAILPTVEQVERIYQQAREEGDAAGYQEGKQQAEAETQRLQALLSDLEPELQQFDQQVAQDLLTLSLDIAKQMLGHALKVRPELVLAIVQEAIQCLPHSTQHAHLILHPDDADLVRSRLGDQLSHSGCKIREDTRIGKGGCRIETGGSQVDATLPTRWHRILAAIGQDGSWLE
jgi:flagellar assembly protein FliH